MHPRHYLKKAAVVLAALGLGAGLTLPAAGCSRGTGAAAQTGTQSPDSTTATPAIPPQDARATAVFETATFALG